MTNIGISTMGLQTPSLKERFQPVIENIKNGWSELKLHEEYLINGFWWHPDTVAKVKQLGVSSLNDWDRAIAFDKLLPSKTVSGAMEVNDFAVKNWRNIWLTRGLLALGALVGAVFFCPGFIGGGGGGGDGNGPDIPKTPTPDGNDCGALIAAWNGLADQLQVNQQSIMSVDAANIDSPQEVIPELQVCFPKLAVNSVDLVLKTDTHTVFSMLVPDTDKDGAGIRPALGVAFNNQINDEGNVPMLIVDASDANLSALRGDKGKIVVKLGEACIVDGGVAGCSDTVVVIEAVDDGLQKFQFQILGDTAWNIDNNAPVELTADQVSNMNGGGWILGIAQAVKDNERAIAAQGVAGILEGVGLDITQVQGVGGNVGGEAHDPFSPDSAVIEKIKSQGFMIVTEGGVACLRSDGTMLSKVTDQIFSNIDPRDIFKLEMEKGQAVVHVENGVNFVYFGEYIEGQFWPRQKEMIGAPGVFGDQVECGGIIVKDLAQIPENIKDKLNLKIGDKLLALMTKDGIILDAIPAIDAIDDDVQLAVVGDGQIRKTVTSIDGQVKRFDLLVDPNLLAPSLPPEIAAALPDDLPASWEAVQAGDTWYIMDNSNNANILRYPVGAETWQARHDVTIGETTYEGWLTDEASTEVVPSIKAGMEYIKIKNHTIGYSSLSTGFGILKEFKDVEITDGQEKMVMTFFTMQYLLNNNQLLTIDFSADKQLVERTGFDISKSLGEPFTIIVLTPTNGESFSDELISLGVELNHLNELQQKIDYSGDWIMPNELLNLLNNPPGDYLDWIGRVLVDQF